MTQSTDSQLEMSRKNVSFPLPIETTKPTEVLECDTKTADNHVPRDSRLIRLTGIHPFNCEAPLIDLYNSGFLTPTELWFVRNHGAVPKVSDDDIYTWTFTIEGLVENPVTIQLNELLKFRQITVPITLVCAGNRRKEQNIIRKGKGFNWGSAGVSTALFTGVFMSELLRMVKPKLEGKYMSMEGADELPHGHYGTSIRLSTAMDPRMKVMVAYKMNGEWLTPDHGRPLRVVIPGQIGGRSVKWLKRIMITDKPSENWYHIYDNRVLPTMLTPEMVDKDHQWWYDERYAIYNLNVQSVICYPTHDEIVQIEEKKFYNVRGYAYNDGGIRIGRVEISLDQGMTWKLSHLNYPEDLYKDILDTPKIFNGILDMKNDEECFCWCFWNLETSIEELAQARDIVVRAMDEYMNIQPRDIYWNVMSMLNNCWHRLTITKDNHNSLLKFEHPTLAGTNPGGWMEKVKEQGGNLTDGFWGSSFIKERNSSERKSSSDIQMIDPSITRIITEEELSKHNQDGNTWFAVNGHVYDASEYLKEHPGGSDSIILASGDDASEDFHAIHSDVAKSMLIKYHIGILQSTNLIKTYFIHQSNRKIFLNPKQWSQTLLKTKKKLNHDTYHLTFQLEHPNQKLGVPIGKHLYLQCRSASGEKVIRSYTPVSDVDQLGYFQLIIKLYRASQTRLVGKMSDCIDRLKEGDFVQCKGPFGDFEYKGKKRITYKGIDYQVNQLTMIAGGSGITPIYQVFRYAYLDGIDCDMIYCNKTEEDILLRNDLENIKEIRHCLSRANEKWNGFRGHISQDIIGHKHQGLLLCCGPPHMEKVVRNIAEQMEWNVDKQLILF